MGSIPVILASAASGTVRTPVVHFCQRSGHRARRRLCQRSGIAPSLTFVPPSVILAADIALAVVSASAADRARRSPSCPLRSPPSPSSQPAASAAQLPPHCRAQRLHAVGQRSRRLPRFVPASVIRGRIHSALVAHRTLQARLHPQLDHTHPLTTPYVPRRSCHFQSLIIAPFLSCLSGTQLVCLRHQAHHSARRTSLSSKRERRRSRPSFLFCISLSLCSLSASFVSMLRVSVAQAIETLKSPPPAFSVPRLSPLAAIVFASVPDPSAAPAPDRCNIFSQRSRHRQHHARALHPLLVASRDFARLAIMSVAHCGHLCFSNTTFAAPQAAPFGASPIHAYAAELRRRGLEFVQDKGGRAC